jgi:hypothetical protein
METKETFFITAGGVTIVTHGRDNVLEWVDFIIYRGLAPVVERQAV